MKGMWCQTADEKVREGSPYESDPSRHKAREREREREERKIDLKPGPLVLRRASSFPFLQVVNDS